MSDPLRAASPPFDAAGVAARLASARSQREVRESILDAVGALVPYDVAGIHALSPRVPIETAVFRGVDVAAMAATVPRWDDLAVELAALREHAIAHGNVAADHEVLVPGSRAHRVWVETALGPQRLRTAAIVHFAVGGVIRGAMLLGRRTRDRFEPEELATLRALAPALGLADLAYGGLELTPTARLPERLACTDQRLTARQREIVEHVALGHTNAEIASALGLSPNTLRNHLATIFAKLGASNRADVVRLAVLLPTTGTNVPAPAVRPRGTPRA